MRSDVRPVLKALGDDTRYQIYNWLRQQGAPVTISSIARRFKLHPNTVRPHLDRLRDAGLVRLNARSQGSVGRPQHRYSAIEADINVRSTPEDAPIFTHMLAALCRQANVPEGDAVEVGREMGRELGSELEGNSDVALIEEMDRLGFEPDDTHGCMEFNNCPLLSVAQEYPEQVCGLHRGIVTGVLESHGGRLREFHDVKMREPCMALYQ